jgi:PRTRC genetic system protein E
MFSALQPLLANLARLTIALVNNTDDTITVTVTPYGGKAGNVLDTPLSLTGTAAEFDDGFVEHLNSYVPKRQTLADQLAATEAILEAAQKEATDKRHLPLPRTTPKDRMMTMKVMMTLAHAALHRLQQNRHQ